MTAPVTYEMAGRNRVPADEQTMYQLRAEQYLRTLTGIDAEEALTFASKRFCAGLLEQEPQSGTQVE